MDVHLRIYGKRAVSHLSVSFTHDIEIPVFFYTLQSVLSPVKSRIPLPCVAAFMASSSAQSSMGSNGVFINCPGWPLHERNWNLAPYFSLLSWLASIFGE